MDYWAQMGKDIRRHNRIPYPGLIKLCWQDTRGDNKIGQGKCIDISASGLRMELPEPVILRSYVTLRSERIGLASSGSVRHCARFGGKYIVGIEFSRPLHMTHPELVSHGPVEKTSVPAEDT